MSKCDFNKAAKQFYWNHTSTWCSPVNLLHVFRTPFSKSTPGWLLLNFLIWVKHSKRKSFLHIFKTKITQNFKQEVISFGLVEEFGNAKLRKYPKIQNKEQTVPVFFPPSTSSIVVLNYCTSFGVFLCAGWVTAYHSAACHLKL